MRSAARARQREQHAGWGKIHKSQADAPRCTLRLCEDQERFGREGYHGRKAQELIEEHRRDWNPSRCRDLREIATAGLQRRDLSLSLTADLAEEDWQPRAQILIKGVASLLDS